MPAAPECAATYSLGIAAGQLQGLPLEVGRGVARKRYGVRSRGCLKCRSEVRLPMGWYCSDIGFMLHWCCGTTLARHWYYSAAALLQHWC